MDELKKIINQSENLISVELKDTDKLILCTDKRIPAEAAKYVSKELSGILGNKVIILTDFTVNKVIKIEKHGKWKIE